MVYRLIDSMWLEAINQIFTIWEFLCHPIINTKKIVEENEGYAIYYILHPIYLLYYLKNSWKGVISFFVAWMITNGWAYVLAFGTSGLLSKIAWWYIGLLYLPFTPEKVITIPLGVFIHGVLWDRQKIKEKVPITRYGYLCLLT